MKMIEFNLPLNVDVVWHHINTDMKWANYYYTQQIWVTRYVVLKWCVQNVLWMKQNKRYYIHLCPNYRIPIWIFFNFPHNYSVNIRQEDCTLTQLTVRKLTNSHVPFESSILRRIVQTEQFGHYVSFGWFSFCHFCQCSNIGSKTFLIFYYF